jgi:HD-GYP domain-containing protein (c-di-GMP phosphodiesterase class II)
MTHDRPYQKGHSEDWALDEIRRCAGTQFDPNLVNIFEHVYAEIYQKKDVSLS